VPVLIHVVADYGHGDLAAAEVRARLALHLPGAVVTYTPVAPFDTIAAGFCVAQLALGEGPAQRLVYPHVAPREDVDDPRPDNEGEPLVSARLAGGVLVVGVAAGSTFAFVAEEAEEMHEVAVPPSGSQFRSRDAFPALLPALIADDRSVLASPVGSETMGSIPPRAVAYVDGYGNLKTTWHQAPADSGARVRVRVGEVEADAIVNDGTFAVAAGELAFAPGSSGWDTRAGGRRQWYELLIRGGSAAELFGSPASGTPVEIVG
jgi:hypothetical protein